MYNCIKFLRLVVFFTVQKGFMWFLNNTQYDSVNYYKPKITTTIHFELRMICISTIIHCRL